MAPDPRVSKAFAAMKNLGIPSETVRPVLINLVKLYNKNWELIEEDNYRTLADAIFEYADDKQRQDKEKDAMASHGSEPPLKKIHLELLEDQASSTMDSSNTKLTLVASEIPPTSIVPKLMESSQACSRDKKTESSSHSLHTAFRNKGKDPISNSGLALKVIKSSSERASSALHSNKRSDETGFDHMLREKMHKGKDPISNPISNSGSPFKVIKSSSERASSALHSNQGSVETSFDRILRENTQKDCPGKGFVVPKRKQAVQDVPRLALPSTVVQSGNPEGSHSFRVVQATSHDRKRPFHKFYADITKGTEKVKISLLDESGNEQLPDFNYIRENTVYQNAYIHFALARIADTGCCSSCKGDCLSSHVPCECAGDTGGEFAYTSEGLLREEFLTKCISMNEAPREHYQVHCIDCPLERAKNEYMPEKCKGHLVRKFIKECWRKCGCDMLCGNRVVQRGITCELQVFLTNEGKGWGLRSLQDLPKGAFVCEYAGEILTNMELYERNQQSSGTERHTYPVILDADWASEGLLKDEEALCLDATFNGNVARFINHRCSDANLLEIPVEVETPDRHYYHLAFFTKRKVNALEELTWDYGIDFSDHNHPIKAFQCCCGSGLCRGARQMWDALLLLWVGPWTSTNLPCMFQWTTDLFRYGSYCRLSPPPPKVRNVRANLRIPHLICSVRSKVRSLGDLKEFFSCGLNLRIEFWLIVWGPKTRQSIGVTRGALLSLLMSMKSHRSTLVDILQAKDTLIFFFGAQNRSADTVSIIEEEKMVPPHLLRTRHVTSLFVGTVLIFGPKLRSYRM